MKARRVQMPLFELGANPSMNLGNIQARRFPIPVVCPVCEKIVPSLVDHAMEVGDPEHMVLEVMES